MCRPPAIAPVVALARAYVAAGVPVVAATSGLRSHVEKHLRAAGLDDIFPSDRIICAADLPPGRGKPMPDIFLSAARLAGADAAKCVAYEDAEAGNSERRPPCLSDARRRAGWKERARAASPSRATRPDARNTNTGFESAWRAGCHVIDVRNLEGYPLPAGLKAIMKQQGENKRAWLKNARQ